MTLNGNFALCFKTRTLLEPAMKISIKIDPYYQRKDVAQWLQFLTMQGLCGYLRRCLGGEASNDSRVIENGHFQGFRTLRLRHLRKWGQHYYILLFSAFSLTPKYVTLKDLEWLNGHLTFSFNYYKLTLRVIIYLFTVESVYIHTWPARCAEAE